MNVLVLGSGGREHALAWKISQSAKIDRLFIAPGNAGTREVGTNLDIDPADFEQVGAFCQTDNIDMVIVGPEAPLVAGIVDFFQKSEALRHIKVIGPDKEAAQLEGSKDFAKRFMERRHIPTAAYKSFQTGETEQAQNFLKSMEPPYVLKADGLAAGKGVLIINNLEEAQKEVAEMLTGKFGKASAKVVIEEFLDGREFSVFALTDGRDYQLLPVAKDYKRINEGDRGLNTGGMGAVSPVSFADDTLMEKVRKQIVEPTIKGIEQEGFYYRGFVFFGLIEVKGQPKVIEYNVRLGDPETEVILPRIENDLLDLLDLTADRNLKNGEVKISSQYCSAVMAVSEGYPGAYEKGKVISGLENLENCLAFHAGTQLKDDKVVSSGGRVIALTAMGNSQDEALQNSYKAAKTICFEGIQYRKDIGYDLK